MVEYKLMQDCFATYKYETLFPLSYSLGSNMGDNHFVILYLIKFWESSEWRIVCFHLTNNYKNDCVIFKELSGIERVTQFSVININSSRGKE